MPLSLHMTLVSLLSMSSLLGESPTIGYPNEVSRIVRIGTPVDDFRLTDFASSLYLRAGRTVSKLPGSFVYVAKVLWTLVFSGEQI